MQIARVQKVIILGIMSGSLTLAEMANPNTKMKLTNNGMRDFICLLYPSSNWLVKLSIAISPIVLNHLNDVLAKGLLHERVVAKRAALLIIFNNSMHPIELRIRDLINQSFKQLNCKFAFHTSIISLFR